MCGGAIISEFIPQRDSAAARAGHGKRGLVCADDFWPPHAADFDDFAAAFHPDQGTVILIVHLHACYLQ